MFVFQITGNFIDWDLLLSQHCSINTSNRKVSKSIQGPNESLDYIVHGQRPFKEDV